MKLSRNPFFVFGAFITVLTLLLWAGSGIHVISLLAYSSTRNGFQRGERPPKEPNPSFKPSGCAGGCSVIGQSGGAAGGLILRWAPWSVH